MASDMKLICEEIHFWTGVVGISAGLYTRETSTSVRRYFKTGGRFLCKIGRSRRFGHSFVGLFLPHLPEI